MAKKKGEKQARRPQAEAGSRKQPWEPAGEENLVAISLNLPMPMKNAVMRIVFERKYAGDVKYSMSEYIREAVAEKLEREGELL